MSDYALSNYVNSFLEKKFVFIQLRHVNLYARGVLARHQCHGIMRETGALFRRSHTAKTTR